MQAGSETVEGLGPGALSELRARYAFAEEIGRGAIGRVFSAVRRPAGESVAIKVFDLGHPSRDGGVAEAFFRREARLLERLDHPAVAGLLEWGVEGDAAYLVMRRERGGSLAELVTGGRRLPLSRVRRVGRAVAAALAHIHEAGIVHRDLRLQNVVARPEGESPAACVIDFGLAREILELSGQDSGAEPDVYRAPEETGALERSVDARTDLYALGGILYRLVTGQPPFRAATTRRLVYLQLAARPAPVTQIVSEVSPVFAAIIAKLLAKDPDDRYQSASSLLQDFAAFERLEADYAARGSAALDQAGARAPRHDVPMVGRDPEVGSIRRAVEAALAGRGRLLLLAGPPGAGKRRLLGVAREQAILREAVVLWGEGATAGSLPFTAVLQPLRQHLALWAREDPHRAQRLGEELRGVLAGWADDLLERLVAPGRRARTPHPLPLAADRAAAEARRETEAVGRALEVLAGTAPALLIVLHDLQASDEGTAALLAQVARGRLRGTISCVASVAPGGEGPVRELLELVEAGGESSSSSLLRAELLEVPPLSELHARELCAELLAPLGTPSPELEQAVLREAGQWPSRIAAWVRERFDAGQLLVQRFKGSRFVSLRRPSSAPGDGPAGESASRGYEPGCVARVRRQVGSAGIAALAPLALLPHEFSFELARVSIGLLADETLLHLDEACAAGLLLRRHGTSRFAFVSAPARAALREHLEEPEASVCGRIAELMAGARAEDPSRTDLEAGVFFLAAGAPGRAVPFLLEEGDAALAARAFRVASARFRSALHATEPEGGSVASGAEARARALWGLGAAQLGLGRPREATRPLERALDAVDDPLVAARVHIALGSAWLRAGDNEAAQVHLEAALPLLDSPPLPRRRIWVLVRVARHAAGRWLRARLPGKPRRSVSTPDARDRARLALARELEYAFFFVDAERSIAVHLWGLGLAEAFGDTPALGYALSTHAVVRSLLGQYERAEAFAARASDIGRALADDLVVAESRKHLGVVRYWQGQDAAARAVLVKAEATYQRLYDPFSLNVVWTYLGLAAVRSGDLAEAERRFRDLRQTSQETGDARGVGLSRYGEARIVALRSGPGPALLLARRAVEVLCEQGDTLFLGVAQTLLGELLLSLARVQEGDEPEAESPRALAEGAIEALRRAEASLRAHHISGGFRIEALVALSEAEATCADLQVELDAAHRRRALRRAWRRARRAEAASARFPGARARAMRGLARVALLRDRTETACGWLRRASEAAERLGHTPEAARARFELAAALRPRSWARAAAEWKRALALARLDDARNAAVGLLVPFGKGVALGPPLSRGGAPSHGSDRSGRPASERLLHKLTAVIDVGKTLIGEEDEARLLGTIVETAMEVTGAERGHLLLFERGAGEERRLVPRLERSTGEAAPVVVDPAGFLRKPGLLRFVAEADEPLLVEDAANDERLRALCRPKTLGELRSIACVPLRTDQTDLGRLYLDSRLIRGLFSEQDLALLATFAAQAALAIETRRSRAALEAKARELQASRAELVQSAKMSAVGELAAGISHEIRNPLNIIGGATYMLGELLQPPPHPKIPGYLTSIQAEVDRASGLIQNLLGFARPSESPGASVSLNGVAERAVELLSELAKQQGLEIVRALCPSVPTAVVNASELQQVVVNLVINAMHALEGCAEGTITIHTRREGADCVLEVEDTGPGVPPELRDRIFEPFVTGRPDGTGLGLYVCYRIVERHGGRLSLSQEPDQGARFTIRLPGG